VKIFKPTILATCMAIGASGGAFVTPVRAEVTVSLPGISVETGRDDHVDRRESTRHDEVVTDKSKSVSHDGDTTTMRKSSETTVR